MNEGWKEWPLRQRTVNSLKREWDAGEWKERSSLLLTSGCVGGGT